MRYEAGAFAALSEEILNGEVGKRQTNAAHDTRLSPTGGQFNLVAGLGDQVPVDVDGSVVIIGLDVGNKLLRVKQIHLPQIIEGAHDGIAVEEVARFGAKLAAHDVFVHAVIARDADIVDGGLRTFADADFKVDRVVLNVDLDGIETAEHITVVIVLHTDGVLVLLKTLVEQRLVVHVGNPGQIGGRRRNHGSTSRSYGHCGFRSSHRQRRQFGKSPVGH